MLIIKRLYNFKFMRFCVVGTTGLFINLSVFYVLSVIALVNVTLASIVAFIVASINNYTINSLWTFGSIGTPINLANYIKYFIANLAGLLLNIIVLNIAIWFIGNGSVLQAQLLAVLSATMFNFVLSRKFVFI